MPQPLIILLTAALSTLGFSILFYVHPRRLALATLGGVLTCGAYLLAGHFLDGVFLPNLIGAGAGLYDPLHDPSCSRWCAVQHHVQSRVGRIFHRRCGGVDHSQNCPWHRRRHYGCLGRRALHPTSPMEK